ncbi:xaa-Pro dipeptidase [Cucumis melo var. makuwa]|uniref:Xaa-Pro dipeptidase n=1 Tax=Cucumis melo var. makuwa TaxID=1194695 RepID=A0A5A7T360_CUCMM|nr:xaa-Pro dipeptidase [Cucumis melo var. makuwa]TYK27199.1 xaa-Pro dipeptidase [Cucumis melo var. makuwa]
MIQTPPLPFCTFKRGFVIHIGTIFPKRFLRNCTDGLSVSLASPDGRIIGDGVGGALVTTTLVQTLEDGDIALFDMGTEYQFYGSDITCSFPVDDMYSMLFHSK